jgi:transcriptional regulator with XRE-family HTH domain
MYINLREVRKNKEMTINELADATGFSNGYISQVERGLTEPSLTSLRKLADALGVSIFSLISDNHPDDIIKISSEEHAVIRNKENTVIYELLTPLSSDRFIPKSLIMKLTVMGKTLVSDESIIHPSEELLTILSGELVIQVGDRETVLSAGDSCIIRSDTPHNLRNDSDKPATGIACLTPPIWDKT